MTNSDPFAHIHRTRDAHTHTALTVARRQLDALIADLDAMLQARRIDDHAPTGGVPGGSRHTNPADPTANTAIRHNPTTDRWARWDLHLAELTHATNNLCRLVQATLHNPTPTGLCRHGDCPDGRPADRGTNTRDGTPRCHACYRFWCDDASNPAERHERQHRGQTPRRIGLEKAVV